MPHSWQTCFFSPEWMTICKVSCSLRLNDFMQICGQGNKADQLGDDHQRANQSRHSHCTRAADQVCATVCAASNDLCASAPHCRCHTQTSVRRHAISRAARLDPDRGTPSGTRGSSTALSHPAPSFHGFRRASDAVSSP